MRSYCTLNTTQLVEEEEEDEQVVEDSVDQILKDEVAEADDQPESGLSVGINTFIPDYGMETDE